MNGKIQYPVELENVPLKIFSSDRLKVGVVGGNERWYKSIVSGKVFDGDSLYAKAGDGAFGLVDGKDIQDVGNFSAYKNSLRDVETSKGRGVMLAYFKRRQESEDMGKINVRLLLGNPENGNVEYRNIFEYNMNAFHQIPLMPDVSVLDRENRINLCYKITSPNSMNFSGRERSEAGTVEFNLEEMGIEIKSETGTNEINPAEAKALGKANIPLMGRDHAYDPVFFNGRKDICVVRLMTENGIDSGFDTIGIVYTGKDGGLRWNKVTDSKMPYPYDPLFKPGDYIHIRRVKETKDYFVLKLERSSKPPETHKIPKKNLGLE